MNRTAALDAFAALAQETRLGIVRLLVRAGRDGMAAGAIGEAMGISPSNASFHLAHLERAGLSASRRDMRSIIYRADIEGLADLARFLLQDCCGGHPEVCGPALTSVLDPCCRAETTDV